LAKIEEKVESLIEPKVQELGYNLYDVEYVKEGKEYYKGQTLNELKLRDIQRNEYYQRFTGMKRDDPKHYDMVVNVLKTGVDGAVKMILDYVEQKESGSK
jgi:GPH family glycoside/pentoside/hexuronide:cation symporter